MDQPLPSDTRTAERTHLRGWVRRRRPSQRPQARLPTPIGSKQCGGLGELHGRFLNSSQEESGPHADFELQWGIPNALLALLSQQHCIHASYLKAKLPGQSRGLNVEENTGRRQWLEAFLPPHSARTVLSSRSSSGHVYESKGLEARLYTPRRLQWWWNWILRSPTVFCYACCYGSSIKSDLEDNVDELAPLAETASGGMHEGWPIGPNHQR